MTFHKYFEGQTAIGVGIIQAGLSMRKLFTLFGLILVLVALAPCQDASAMQSYKATKLARTTMSTASQHIRRRHRAKKAHVKVRKRRSKAKSGHRHRLAKTHAPS